MISPLLGGDRTPGSLVNALRVGNAATAKLLNDQTQFRITPSGQNRIIVVAVDSSMISGARVTHELVQSMRMRMEA